MFKKPQIDKFDCEEYFHDEFSDSRNLQSLTYSLQQENYKDTQFIIRIAGCDFENILRFINKQDRSICDCFIETTSDLVSHYNAQAGWTMGDNILLFFDYNENQNDEIVWNTETMLTQIASYTTIRFDKHINSNISNIANEYGAEIANDLLEQDFVFRTVLVTPEDEDELVDYMDYIVYRTTQFIKEEWAYFGTLIKQTLDENDKPGVAFRHITDENAESFLKMEFIFTPHLDIVSNECDDNDEQ